MLVVWHRLKQRKVKNESINAMGDKVGRIHVGRQDLDAMKVRRVKALRKGKDEGEEGEEGGAESPVDSGDEYDDEEEGGGGSDFDMEEGGDSDDDDDMET